MLSLMPPHSSQSLHSSGVDASRSGSPLFISGKSGVDRSPCRSIHCGISRILRSSPETSPVQSQAALLQISASHQVRPLTDPYLKHGKTVGIEDGVEALLCHQKGTEPDVIEAFVKEFNASRQIDLLQFHTIQGIAVEKSDSHDDLFIILKGVCKENPSNKRLWPFKIKKTRLLEIEKQLKLVQGYDFRGSMRKVMAGEEEKGRDLSDDDSPPSSPELDTRTIRRFSASSEEKKSPTAVPSNLAGEDEFHMVTLHDATSYTALQSATYERFKGNMFFEFLNTFKSEPAIVHSVLAQARELGRKEYIEGLNRDEFEGEINIIWEEDDRDCDLTIAVNWSCGSQHGWVVIDTFKVWEMAGFNKFVENLEGFKAFSQGLESFKQWKNEWQRGLLPLIDAPEREIESNPKPNNSIFQTTLKFLHIAATCMAIFAAIVGVTSEYKN